MKTIAIVQPSLREDSYTDILCKMLAEKLERQWINIDYIDLRQRNIELCDGRTLHEYSQESQRDYNTIKSADIVIFGFPLYHFAITGVLKNFIDICDDALQDKKVDFIVTALFPGGDFAHEHIIQSLAMKYNVQKLFPETVYCLNSDFMGSILINKQIEIDIENLVEKIVSPIQGQI